MIAPPTIEPATQYAENAMRSSSCFVWFFIVKKERGLAAAPGLWVLGKFNMDDASDLVNCGALNKSLATLQILQGYIINLFSRWLAKPFA